jgi:transposase
MKSRPLNLETKLALLAIAQETGCVAFACLSAGISRTTFYKIKRAFECHGFDGLRPPPRRRPRMPNAFPEEIVAKILEETRNFPSYSYNRLAAHLRALGLAISGSGVRKVWNRHRLSRRSDRALWRASIPLAF